MNSSRTSSQAVGVAGMAAYSYDWDRSAFGQFAKHPGELKAIHARHPNIQKNQIGTTETGGIESAGTAVTSNGIVSPQEKHLDCDIGRIDYVIYHQDVMPSKVHNILPGTSCVEFCVRIGYVKRTPSIADSVMRGGQMKPETLEGIRQCEVRRFPDACDHTSPTSPPNVTFRRGV
jgi:hypothetical protein